MTTVVCQSYRSSDVPGWIEQSLQSVRAWAQQHGHAYDRLDDAFFDPVPAWYRDKVGGEPVRMSDLARLLAARRLLERHERVIWVDADIVVFDPSRFVVDAPEGYAFCREVWISVGKGGLTRSDRVNNAVTVFTRGSPFLEFYVHACESIVRASTEGVSKLAVGTAFLTRLAQAMPLPLLGSVALPSPPVVADMVRGSGHLVATYMSHFGGPARAANLCASLRGHEIGGVQVDDALLGAAFDRLMKTRGEALNGHCRGGGHGDVHGAGAACSPK
ncbi:MAG TPA: hypothetical protein VGG39_22345 [Polyangiaceae bacterium]